MIPLGSGGIFLLLPREGGRNNVIFVEKAYDIFVKKVLYYIVEKFVPWYENK